MVILPKIRTYRDVRSIKKYGDEGAVLRLSEKGDKKGAYRVYRKCLDMQRELIKQYEETMPKDTDLKIFEEADSRYMSKLARKMSHLYVKRVGEDHHSLSK